jgi:uncharacterized membrane protein
MWDTVTFLKDNLADHFVIYFIPLYAVGGRPVAILSAQLLGYKISFLLPVVVLLDTLQIPLLYHLYSKIGSSALVGRLQKRLARKERGLRAGKIFRWMQLLGMPGIVAVTMTPMKGCGMWSGVLLSKMLGIAKPWSYPLLILGSLLGTLLVYGIGEAVSQLVAAIWKP